MDSLLRADEGLVKTGSGLLVVSDYYPMYTNDRQLAPTGLLNYTDSNFNDGQTWGNNGGFYTQNGYLYCSNPGSSTVFYHDIFTFVTGKRYRAELYTNDRNNIELRLILGYGALNVIVPQAMGVQTFDFTMNSDADTINIVAAQTFMGQFEYFQIYEIP